MDPIVYGKYPKIMESLLGSRLPKFTKEQSDLLKGSYDFIGLNYYTTNYAEHAPLAQNAPPSYNNDYRANLTSKFELGYMNQIILFRMFIYLYKLQLGLTNNTLYNSG